MTPRQRHYYTKLWTGIWIIQYIDNTNRTQMIKATIDRKLVKDMQNSLPRWFYALSRFHPDDPIWDISGNVDLWKTGHPDDIIIVADLDLQMWRAIGIDSILSCEPVNCTPQSYYHSLQCALEEHPIILEYVDNNGKECVEWITADPQYCDRLIFPHPTTHIHGVNADTGRICNIPFDSIVKAYKPCTSNGYVNNVPNSTISPMLLQYYHDKLSKHICLLTFVKKDNTVRKMVCTLQPNVLSQILGVERSFQGCPNTAPFLRVMDLDLGNWRTINTHKLLSFEVTDQTYKLAKQLTTRDV